MNFDSDITYCNNPRCQIKQVCKLDDWPDTLEHVSMTIYGPDNGDPVTKAADCDMYIARGE